jgi:hypothetical protein
MLNITLILLQIFLLFLLLSLNLVKNGKKFKEKQSDIMKYNYCVTQFLGDKTAENSFKSILFHL